MQTSIDAPGYYRCHNDVFYAANLAEATDHAARCFLGGPQKYVDQERMTGRAYPRTTALRLYPKHGGSPRIVEQRPGYIRVEHCNRRIIELTVHRVGGSEYYSITRDLENAAPIVRVYVNMMRDAAQDGHPAVRVSKRSGLPVFTDDYYRCWASRGNPHLDYSNPARAAEQILDAGIGDDE
jgi:hypothetical protein